jgi:ribosomal protein L16 Arg81 hydroxylase
MHDHGLTLADLLHPIDTETFFRDYWEKRPLIVSRKQPDYYGGLFSIADVDNMLVYARPRYPEVRVASKDSPAAIWKLLSSGWMGAPDAPARIDAAHEVFAQGQTIVVNNLQQRWHDVALLCRNIMDVLHHPVGANLYMTPKRAQGFAVHFDTHDVWIVQVHGAKRWRVYDPPIELPRPREFFPMAAAKVGPPVHDFTLEAGDMLYMPRGWAHEAFTSDVVSAHITIGAHGFTWVDVINRAVDSLAHSDARFRRYLPVGFINAQAGGEENERFLAELLEAVRAQAKAQPQLDDLGSAFVDGLTALPDGHFARDNDTNGVGPDTLVERRPGMVCKVSATAAQSLIRFPGNSVTGPAWLAPALRQVAATAGPFTVRDLPDPLTDDSKVLLARRLIKEGLLRIATPA